MEMEPTKQIILNDLHSKWILTDMKSKIIQTICSTMDDEVYTKNDAIDDLLEVVALIELEEKKFNPNEAREQLLNR